VCAFTKVSGYCCLILMKTDVRQQILVKSAVANFMKIHSTFPEVLHESRRGDLADLKTCYCDTALAMRDNILLSQ
jgi:hypothetical protein